MANINSKIEDGERLNNSLRQYIYDRIWSDEYLLGGFTMGEVNAIIEDTTKLCADEINTFVAEKIENIANLFYLNKSVLKDK